MPAAFHFVLAVQNLIRVKVAGLHGAAVVITGRRENVLRDSVAALQADGVTATAVTVCLFLILYRSIVATCGKVEGKEKVRNSSAACWPENSFGLQGDIRKEADVKKWVQQTLERHDRLDILVNCAAGNFLVSCRLHSSSGL